MYILYMFTLLLKFVCISGNILLNLKPATYFKKNVVWQTQSNQRVHPYHVTMTQCGFTMLFSHIMIYTIPAVLHVNCRFPLVTDDTSIHISKHFSGKFFSKCCSLMLTDFQRNMYTLPCTKHPPTTYCDYFII